MNKLLVICGPTATGKTRLGIELAKKFSGEIVSADSRQVYRGMDIGTGKDLPVNANLKSQISKLKLKTQNFQLGYYLIETILVWLLDVVEPDYRFNVADYKKCAEIGIEDILKRGKLPILVGGTGFYIKAVVDGIETIGVKADWQLRKELQDYNVTKLQGILEDLDPRRYQMMNESDRKNPRRLIRAIEIARKCKMQNARLQATCNVGQAKCNPPAGGQNTKLNTLFIGLTAPNKILYEKIDQRVDKRVRNGIEEEIRGLLAKGYNWENSALGTTLAYREWRGYFEGKTTKEEVVETWKFAEHKYSRRQMTWFRRDSRINWFDIIKEGWQAKVEKIVESWYS